jgi:hypothetical protein
MKEELEGLRQIRDELRVQSELGQAELRDRFDGLEKRWHELEGKLKVLREEASGDVENVKDAARLLAAEIRDGYKHLKSRL